MRRILVAVESWLRPDDVPSLVDAALAALTGVHALSGHATSITAGGFALVLPVREVPATRVRRDEAAAEAGSFE